MSVSVCLSVCQRVCQCARNSAVSESPSANPPPPSSYPLPPPPPPPPRELGVQIGVGRRSAKSHACRNDGGQICTVTMCSGRRRSGGGGGWWGGGYASPSHTGNRLNQQNPVSVGKYLQPTHGQCPVRRCPGSCWYGVSSFCLPLSVWSCCGSVVAVVSVSDLSSIQRLVG